MVGLNASHGRKLGNTLDYNPGFSVELVTRNTCHGCQKYVLRLSKCFNQMQIDPNKRTTFCTSSWVNYRLLVAFATYLSSVLVVEVNSLFADQRMTEQSLRISATLKYGRHIEFINLNPGLSQMSSFHVQKPCPLKSERPNSQGYWTFSQNKCHSMFKRDLKETSFIYLLSRPRFHSEIIWGGYRRGGYRLGISEDIPQFSKLRALRKRFEG